jgi:hypothetical protein
MVEILINTNSHIDNVAKAHFLGRDHIVFCMYSRL